VQSLAAVRAYWDARVHDTKLSDDPPGSRGYFAAMSEYRYGKLGYLPDLIGFGRWQGRRVLDIGCGAGIDLVRLARAGATAWGLELSRGSLAMARRHLEVGNQQAVLVEGDAARLPFPGNSFDLVLCLGVLPFAPDPAGIVTESRRVLRRAGTAIFVTYNRRSMMNVLRTVSAVAPGHGDAPFFRMQTRAEFEALLAPFPHRTIRTARFGWHLIARCGSSRDVAGDGG
jgi:SAM-dependent methyltransferase